ncbi:MAG: serine/threonine-protein kinase [Polyangiaceae bacterium]
MGTDELDTVVDLPPRRGLADGKSAPRGTPLEIPTVDLPQPEAVLRGAEIEQARRTAIAGLIFTFLGLVVGPFLPGDPTARLLFQIGLAISVLANAALFWVANDERRYSERRVIAYFLAAPISNALVMYYLGVFGPIVVIFVLNLYTACLGFGRRVARVALVVSYLPMVVLGSAMTFGLLKDPGLISASPMIGSLGMGVALGLFLLFMALVYVQASSARRVLVASLVERDRAIVRASQQQALLLEARQELENALHAGGLGRFSDQTLGSFKLGVVLGRGGMGEVYEAQHVDGGEPAAVKLLLPGVLGRPEFVQRFRREVRIAASVSSPHVAKVLEVGDESAPFPYLAMERLEGEDLAQILLQRGRLDPVEVVDMLHQVGKGVRAASDAGIVHRDLKPQNLFLTQDGVWKVLDFGVSKLQDAAMTLTQGETVGTPYYMAPEQARGEAVDLRTDLYSLGAIAYRALTGHQPFAGREIAAVLLAVLSDMPPRPSRLARLPADVDHVLAIAIAKRPEDRFTSPRELTDAMRRAVGNQLTAEERNRAARLLDELPWGS